MAQATFAQLDADHDGAVSKGEAAASAELSAAFAGLDADGNGSLDSTEYGKFAAMQGTSNDASDQSDTNDDSDKKEDGTLVPESH